MRKRKWIPLMRGNNQIHRSLSFLHAPFYLPSASWLTSHRQASRSSYLINVGREDRRDLCQAWKETSSISEWEESIFNRMLIDLQGIFVVFTSGRRLSREEEKNVTEKEHCSSWRRRRKRRKNGKQPSAFVFVGSFVHQSHLDEDRCWRGMCLCTHRTQH